MIVPPPPPPRAAPGPEPAPAPQPSPSRPATPAPISGYSHPSAAPQVPAPQTPVAQAAVAPPRAPDFITQHEYVEPKTIEEYLAAARQWGCSDLHLSVGRPPFVRRNGEIHYLDQPPLSPERAEELNFKSRFEEQQQHLLERRQLEFVLEIQNIGRHRCSVYHQQLGWDGSYRILPNHTPTFEQLGFPPVMRALISHPDGLVLVTGPAGSGKTTTVAAMLDFLNRTRSGHIVTIENPIEYVLASQRCQMTQREVGLHTLGFADGLRAALREDPDIIFVGEMNDFETISQGISAAEQGYLVLSTLQTTTSARTVARLLDAFPPEERDKACIALADCLRGVAAQQLIPRKDGEGMVLALEILIMSGGIAQQIREGKTYQIPALIQAGKRAGMRVMDESLLELVQQGIISGREAWQRAENKALFEAVKEK